MYPMRDLTKEAIKVLRELSEEQQGTIARAILNYASCGEETE